ncbi:MAG: hypothetical protein WCV90_02035 [Candidatus Woesearchaeota archaeon]
MKTVGFLLYEGCFHPDIVLARTPLLAANHLVGEEFFSIINLAEKSNVLTSATPPNYRFSKKLDVYEACSPLDACPKLNVLIVPGGDDQEAIKSPNLREFISSIYPGLDYLVTLCGGSYILGVSCPELIVGHTLTSHHKRVEQIEKEGLFSGTEWVVDPLVVSGKIVSTGNVYHSAKASLYLLHQYLGESITSLVKKDLGLS